MFACFCRDSSNFGVRNLIMSPNQFQLPQQESKKSWLRLGKNAWNMARNIMQWCLASFWCIHMIWSFLQTPAGMLTDKMSSFGSETSLWPFQMQAILLFWRTEHRHMLKVLHIYRKLGFGQVLFSFCELPQLFISLYICSDSVFFVSCG